MGGGDIDLNLTFMHCKNVMAAAFINTKQSTTQTQTLRFQRVC